MDFLSLLYVMANIHKMFILLINAFIKYYLNFKDESSFLVFIFSYYWLHASSVMWLGSLLLATQKNLQPFHFHSKALSP